MAEASWAKRKDPAYLAAESLLLVSGPSHPRIPDEPSDSRKRDSAKTLVAQRGDFKGHGSPSWAMDGALVHVVEPERKLVEVGLEVLRRDTLADTDDRSLEQRPERLDAHDVHVPIHERLSMVDGRVGVSDSGSDPPRGDAVRRARANAPDTDARTTRI